MSEPSVQSFFDATTNTYTYVLHEPDSGQCAIIDSVLDFDVASGSTSTQSADDVIRYVRSKKLTVAWLLETHVHADHLTAAPYLQQALGGKTAISEQITQVQTTFGNLFNTGAQFRTDGAQFDQLLRAGQCLPIGSMEIEVMHTPGHTPACVSYIVGDIAFVGDTLFMPDYGTARTDFPGGDAATLYQSIHKLLALPAATRLFLCHDYLAPGREEYACQTTVQAQRQNNVHVGQHVSEADFVAMRTERDRTLSAPRLMLPAVQVNMRAGHFPEPEENGVSYLKIPINAF